jgi:hypothetical protein
MFGVRRLYAEPMASVLAPDYAEVVRATPERGAGRLRETDLEPPSRGEQQPERHHRLTDRSREIG